MAQHVIGSLRVNLGLDSAAFDAGLKNARAGLAKFGGLLKTALAASAAAAAAALGGLGLAIRGVLQDAREMTNLAQVANAGFEEFQGLAYAAKTVGIEHDKLADIFKDVNDRVGDFFATGAGPMVDFFDRIAPKVGVTAEAFRNLSGPQALQLYYDSLVKAGASQQDLTFFLEAMASDVTALIPLLADGGAEFSRLAEEARRLGIVMDEETGARAREFSLTIDRIQMLFKGMVTQITTLILPALQAVADSFYNAAGDGERMNFIIDASVFAFKALASVGIGLIDVFRGLSEILMGVYDALSMIQQGDWTGANSRMENAWHRTGDIMADSLATMEKIWGETQARMSGAPMFTPRGTPGGGIDQYLDDSGKAAAQAGRDAADAWAGLREVAKESETAMAALGSRAETVASTIENSVSSWVDSALDGTFRLQDALADLARDIVRMFAQRAVGNLVSSLFGSLPGFANGGSFQVGGSGGVDSQLVAFRATPNERVTVTRPNQMLAGAANVNVQVINNNGSQVTTQGRGTAGDPLRIVVDAVKADIGRGGMDTAMGRFGVKPATRQR